MKELICSKNMPSLIKNSYFAGEVKGNSCTQS